MRTNSTKGYRLIFYALMVLISFFDAAIFLSMRSIWFYIGKTIGTGLPGAFSVFIFSVVSFLYSLILFIKYLKKPKGNFKGFRLINIILPLLLITAFSAIDIYIYSQLGNSYNIVLTSLIEALPWFLLISAILFFIIYYPDLSISRIKAFKYISAAIAVIAILIYLSNFGDVKITSGPVIQIVDDSKLSVVWTTDKNSTAYVEYGPDENSLKKATNSHYGLIDANTTVHKVILPFDEQNEFIYRVGSTKINHYFQNSIEYGNTAISDFRKFKDYRKNKKITFYVLNDIHENVNLYKEFLADKDFDFVVLNGDIVNSIDNRQVIINKILKPISENTNGTKPYYLVRGNHETRGASARELPQFLSLPQDNFYYTFHAGLIYGILLDSAEDKLDSHEEYSGLADFEKYLDAETKWLQALSQSEDYRNAKYKIAFVHIPLDDFDDQEGLSYLRIYQQKWRELLNNMEIDAVFSGHAHSAKLIKQDGVEFAFDTFIGGGDSMNQKEFTAIKAEVTEESMKIYYVNTSGEILQEYEIF